MLPICGALVLTAHSLVAGSGAQVCVDFVVLSVPIPQLRQLASGQHDSRPSQAGNGQPTPLVCPCNRRAIDEFGDHIHTCKKHTGGTKDARETVLTALEPRH
jgi:hypothetical protein